jgi:coenzyme F420-reducing hydrogenase alpha subunit
MKKKIKRIKIEHIDKIEGHGGFVSDIINGDIKKAKFEIQMGIRLFERILIGRYFEDVPIITARVCGVCPVVHYSTATKALEKALNIKAPPDVVLLRKLMMLGQIIQSHSLHTFFMSLSDFYNIRKGSDLIKRFPKYTKLALSVRDFGNKLIFAIGFRSIHPVAGKVGGFRKLPDKKGLENLLQRYEEVLSGAESLALFFAKLPYPEFFRKTEFIGLKSKGEYAIYDGDIVSTEGLNISPSNFEKVMEEIQLPYEIVKRIKHRGTTIMPGALARLNLNSKKLNPKAKKILNYSGTKFPCHNSFYNIFAQTVEMVHCVEEAKKILEKILDSKLKTISVPYKIKEGFGSAAIEAPRGTLYHAYQLDRNGRIKKANIITPTAQFVSNLEEDIKEFLPKTKSLSKKAQERKIKMLIRAYDPCITCSVH